MVCDRTFISNNVYNIISYKKEILIGVFVVFSLATITILYYSNNSTKNTDTFNKAIRINNQHQKTESKKKNTDDNIIIKAKNKPSDKAVHNDIEEISEYMKYVVSIKKPSKKDLEIIEHAVRYGEEGFEAGLRPMFKHQIKDIDEKTIQKLLSIGKLSAYRHSMLIEAYVDGKITKEFLLKEIRENMNLTYYEHKQTLSKEQYEEFVGENIDEESTLDMETVIENQFFSTFPNIKQNNQNIKKLEYLYEYVDAETVEKLIEIDENDSKFALQLEFKIDKGEMSEDEAITLIDNRRNFSEKTILELLTDEQEKLFFSESEDLIKNDSDFQNDSEVLTQEQEDELDKNGTLFVPATQ